MKEQSLQSKENKILKDDLKMYEVPGQTPITERAFKRYLNNKEQDSLIAEKVGTLVDQNDRELSYKQEEVRKETDTQRTLRDKIMGLPIEERATFIRSGLENSDVNLQIAVAEILPWIKSSEIMDLLIVGLQNPNPDVRKIVIEKIEYLSKKEFSHILKICLESPYEEVRLESLKIIGHVPEEEKLECLNLIIEKGLGEKLIQPPLYKENDINNINFSRHDFNKSGSETTLLGGKLKDRTIIRRIKPEAFLAWQELYENNTAWKEAGFDYVPIEPIQSYTLAKDGLVEVYSGVLDLSLRSWNSSVGLFSEELMDERIKILDVLEKLKIEHGHTHNDNFCLRFFRDEKGNVDFTKKPRLYLIDFDKSKS